jgi:hypothetical protein
MKKLLYTALSLLAVAFTACKDDTVDVDWGFLKVISSDVDFDYRGGTGQIVVDAKGTLSATVTEGVNWASAVVDGNVVTVTVAENANKMSRNASVRISADGHYAIVPVSQLSAAMQINETSVTFNATASDSSFADLENRKFTFMPVTSGNLRVTCDADWITSITLDGAAGVAVISPTTNTSALSRSTVAVLSFGEISLRVPITQAGAKIFVEPASVTVPHKAGTQEVSFFVPGDAPVATATSSSPSWLTVEFDNTSKKIILTWLDNYTLATKSATVTLATATGVSATLPVSQDYAKVFTEWADVEFTAEINLLANNPTNKAIKLLKAEGINLFRFDGPWVANFNYYFVWDINTKATSITPVGLSGNVDDIPTIRQNTGITDEFNGGEFPIYMFTNPDPEYSGYVPDHKVFLIKSLYGLVNDTELVAHYNAWFYDTFRITAFHQGNPWE